MKKYALFLISNMILCHCAFGSGFLSAQKFPTTYSDVSFVERMQVEKAGYEPFMDMKAYQELNVVPGEEHYTEREIAKAYLQQQADKQNLNNQEYCAKYPDDTENCKGYIAQKSENIYSGNTAVFTKNIGSGIVVENNYVTGQACYPADSDTHFQNIIFTSGRYESISPAFEKGLITVFRKEGECGTIANDPCGYTCYGIGSKCNNVDVTKITRADAEDIYYNNYWYNNRLYVLPDVISTDVFLAVMASGPQTAIRQFRTFLGLPSNGGIDNSVIDAVKNYRGDIHNDWMNVRDKFLQDVAERRYKGAISKGYKNAIELKRKNGCHVRPQYPLYRN